MRDNEVVVPPGAACDAPQSFTLPGPGAETTGTVSINGLSTPSTEAAAEMAARSSSS